MREIGGVVPRVRIFVHLFFVDHRTREQLSRIAASGRRELLAFNVVILSGFRPIRITSAG